MRFRHRRQVLHPSCCPKANTSSSSSGQPTFGRCPFLHNEHVQIEHLPQNRPFCCCPPAAAGRGYTEQAWFDARSHYVPPISPRRPCTPRRLGSGGRARWESGFCSIVAGRGFRLASWKSFDAQSGQEQVQLLTTSFSLSRTGKYLYLNFWAIIIALEEKYGKQWYEETWSCGLICFRTNPPILYADKMIDLYLWLLQWHYFSVLACKWTQSKAPTDPASSLERISSKTTRAPSDGTSTLVPGLRIQVVLYWTSSKATF